MSLCTLKQPCVGGLVRSPSQTSASRTVVAKTNDQKKAKLPDAVDYFAMTVDSEQQGLTTAQVQSYVHFFQ